MTEKENTLNESPRLFVTGGRDYSVDILRCISCFMVVVIHTVRMVMPYCGRTFMDPGSIEWGGCAFYMSIVASPTVLFVMVSGIFFLTPQRYVTPRKVWTKNIPKMACAYVFWCLIYALYRIYFRYQISPVTPKVVILQWLIEPAHLWYIPMIITLYMLCPFFRCITEKNDMKLYKYGLILFVAALIINTVITTPHIPYGGYMNTIADKTPVDDICQYSFWMVMGYYLYTYRPSPKTRKILYVAGLAALFASFIISLLSYKYLGYGAANAINGKFTITTFFKNIALFLLITNGLKDIKLSERGTKILSKVSSCTLMIYLVHLLIIYIILDNLKWFSDTNMLIGVWIISIITYVVGFLIGWGFQAIPWKKMRNRVLDQFFPDRTVLVTKRK